MPTRQQQQAELEHVLDTILLVPNESPLRLALAYHRIVSVHQILTLEKDEIKALTYLDSNDPNNQPKTISAGDAAYITPLCPMARYRAMSGNPIEDWNTVSHDDFHEFHQKYVFAVPRQPIPVQGTQQQGRSMASPLATFEKGIKRDPSLFPTLSDYKRWNTFARSLKIQAKAQGLSDVIDPDYVPIGNDAEELFKRQNAFMLGVFDSKLKTDQAKEAIRKHVGEPFAAQLIYKDVKEFGEKSTSADIKAGKLLGYISNVQLGSPQLA